VNDEVDEKLGFTKIQEGGKREAWLINMHPVSLSSLAITIQRAHGRVDFD
jgi:hypothetical protein